jgi:DNA-binding beta-propeller fold protein YncE
LMEIPLPSDLVAHHIFFNRDRSKAYVTALGKSVLHVMDLTKFPYRLRSIDVPDCQVGEDLVVSEDNRTWYLTCMGSNNVIMGDARADKPIKTVSTADPAVATILYPHGIAIHNGIDRVLVTSTVKPDMSARCCRPIKSDRSRLRPNRPRWKSCSAPMPIRRSCTLPI